MSPVGRTPPPSTSATSFAEHVGEAAGLIAGEVVTVALAASPKWRQPVVDSFGREVRAIPGATRIGNHPIEERHKEVVGPKITAAAAKMEPGLAHDLVEGFGAGATEAPGATYRIESAIKDFFARLFR